MTVGRQNFGEGVREIKPVNSNSVPAKFDRVERICVTSIQEKNTLFACYRSLNLKTYEN